ncbi:MAG: hypothetical protein VR64_21750 [Desulfatitalea sp. BRH_c12]|nr:MAG: hypothetical protein VR64_21750 [Desulfatitalea sp. BRH_c12]
MIACVLPLIIAGMPAWSASVTPAQSKYHEAERCVLEVTKSPQLQKSRDQWLNCIKKFNAAYHQDPKGPWAAACLYRAGLLHGELHKRFKLESDRLEGLDLLNTIVRNFSSTSYRARAVNAAEALRAAPGANVKTEAKIGSSASTPPRSSSKSDAQRKTDAPNTADRLSKADQWYKKAKVFDQRLQEKPALQKRRDQWFNAINAYRQTYQSAPDGPLAPAALLGMAEDYAGMYKWSRNPVDRLQSQKTFQELIKLFPQSPLVEKARLQLDDGISMPDEDAIAQIILSSDANRPAVQNVTQISSAEHPAVVESLRFWSNPRYTRVVIDASADTTFTYNDLREDPSSGKPQRIYIDMNHCRLSQELQKVIPINDNLLSDARAGQYTSDTVRVVVDIKSSKTYKVFSLKNPFRIVLDVWGADIDNAAPIILDPPRIASSNPAGPVKKLPVGAIAKQLALGVRRIVIDPGHGGKDYGAPGAIKGVHEKNIVLQISQKLAKKIRSELNCDVVLTRDSDSYLSLEERTAIANTKYADLFVSIHTNASPNPKAHGVETFILNLATDDESIRVAARENATSTKNISDLDSILKDLMQNAKVTESTRLASYVQQGALTRMKKLNGAIRDKGVKKAPFYVLLGAEMPSILFEAGFISNAEECRRLISADYQDHLCQGIVDGIKRYIEDIHPMAISHPTDPNEQG